MDLSTREGRKAHLESEWAAAKKQKEEQKIKSIEWMKKLDGNDFLCLLHFVRNPEDFEDAVFNAVLK